jgi:heme-degrading monooxygenase HmoA
MHNHAHAVDHKNPRPLKNTLRVNRKESPMIAREWKCRVPNVHSEGFTAYLYETGIKDSSATPGSLGAQIFRRTLAGKIELTLITYWDKLESITAFAGSDISQARLYPEDEVYELDPDLSVQHYEVIEHQISPEQQRTLFR